VVLLRIEDNQRIDTPAREFLSVPADALTRVMRVTVPIPAVAPASVLYSSAVGRSVMGDVGTL